MGFVQRLDRHADLVQRMADTLHVDFGEAMLRGTLAPEELRSAVFRCMGCECVSACADWLEAHAEGADRAPGYCRNRDMLGGLRD